MIKKISLLLFTLLISFSSLAEVKPVRGQEDNRIRYIDYAPNDVVKIDFHFGYQVHMVLSDDEYVEKKGVYIGDADAWAFATKGNHVFLRPKAEGGATNMTMITNKYIYTLDLNSHWPKQRPITDKDHIYKVKFNYPVENMARERQRILAENQLIESKKRLAETEAKLAEIQSGFKEKLNEHMPTKNTNYWVQGSSDLTPDEAYDDGRFTTLVFNGNRPIPAIFVVNEDGSESLVNRSVSGNKVEIHTLARKFVIRKGQLVTCVFNKSYDPIGNDNKSGTTLPRVERVIKENKE